MEQSEINNKKKRLLIVGPAPHNNVGGVSIHLRRLVMLLKDYSLIDYIDEGRPRWKGVYNIRSLNLFKYIQKIIKSDVIYINSSVFILRICNILASKLFFRRTVVTIHRDLTIERNKKYTIAALKLCDSVIVVNDKTLEYLNKYIKASKIHLLPAFLPPIIDEEPDIPSHVKVWIDKVRKREDSILMISNASRLVLRNGEDLYGMDMCIDLISKLIEMNKSNYYLIFIAMTYSEEQRLMLENYKKRVIKEKLQDNILIVDEQLSFVRLITLSDIVLRTTNTDGDAISIREGLFYGKTVIASDVVKRPEGVLTFKTRDTNSLVDVVLSSKIKDSDNKSDTQEIDYLKLYLSILKLN